MLFGWAGAVTYSAIRSLIAVGLAIRVPTLGGWMARRAISGQAIADACFGAFPIAYVSHGFRAALGLLWVPLFLYAAAWEVAWYVRELGDAASEDQDTALDTLEAPWKAVWGLVFVLPSLVAGGIVAFDALYPNQWRLAGDPPPFACRPARLRAGDTLTVTMATPHGGELGAFTPGGRFLYIVPFAAKSRSGAPGFARLPEMRLVAGSATGRVTPTGPRQPLFTDSGTYQLQLSQESEISASQVCRVWYAGTPR